MPSTPQKATDVREIARGVVHECLSPECWGGRENLAHLGKCEQFTLVIAAALRAYGSARHAEGERAGIEAAAKIADDIAEGLQSHEGYVRRMGKPYTVGFSGAAALAVMNTAAAIRAINPVKP